MHLIQSLTNVARTFALARRFADLFTLSDLELARRGLDRFAAVLDSSH